ncbi:MAG: hypothetical protein M3068_04190 [Gemmatimonadota bacterium]|nr:hypothetical protein [Gemmatimonadota bacterium]
MPRVSSSYPAIGAAPRPRPPLRRRLLSAATDHLPLKLAALFFALVLWLVVSAEGPAEEWSPVRLVLSRDSAVHLRGEPPEIQALVVGRGREIVKLYNTPPVIRRTATAAMPERLTFELRPTDVEIPSGVDAQVRDVRPHSIALRFTVTVQRIVPVVSALRIMADSGVRATGQPRFAPESVRVIGTRTVVEAIEGVRTTRSDLLVRDSGTQSVTLDTAGLEARVVPAVVRVSVPVVRDSVPARVSARRRGSQP